MVIRQIPFHFLSTIRCNLFLCFGETSMKVLLLGFAKISYMPYMNFYLDLLSDKENIQLDLVYWDRDGLQDSDVPQEIKNAYKFEAHLEEELPFRKKLKFFAKYRSFALKVLKSNSYDKIIVLHTTPGLTILDYLCRYYKGKYILDFRDVSHENISFYRRLVGKLTHNSSVTFVSSDAFRKYLPEDKQIYTIHNYLEESLSKRDIRSGQARERDCIRVCFWGLIRQVTPNQRLMDALGNDCRFELHYFGRMQQDGRNMENYAIEKGYHNVFFHGQYKPSERYSFAENTDLLHNVYDLDKTMKNAMANKYYDGIIFRIPQICTKGSHMGDMVEEREVGLSIDLNDVALADRIWDYYNSISWQSFSIKCDDALKLVLDEQRIAKDKLLEVIK